LKNFRNPNYTKLVKAAIKYSDALVIGSEKINPELEAFARESNKPLLEYHDEDSYLDAYNEFYDSLLNNKKD